MRTRLAAPALVLVLAVSAHAAPALVPDTAVELVQRKIAQTCKDMRTCEEAVRLWCDGYNRADGDSDGIPCETVCSTRAQVDAIREQIGC